MTLHALYDLSEVTRAGVFLGYGQQTPQDLDMDDAYDVMFYGLEIQTRLADNVEVYAQIGAGDKVADGQDSSEGWNGGIIGRFGMNYDITSNTMLNFDFEIGASRNYIDSSDPGRFFGVTIGGKTRIMEDTPLYANYFARYDYLSATDEGDNIDEVQFGVGLQYAFGGGSNLISSPRLPTRASAWTEWID
ncbi:MAG: hypothetical protein JKY41_02220 [Rhodobacteraceae bacterium]|nr:hypothetical protein [Paracoccaceae bacterium]